MACNLFTFCLPTKKWDSESFMLIAFAQVWFFTLQCLLNLLRFVVRRTDKRTDRVLARYHHRNFICSSVRPSALNGWTDGQKQYLAGAVATFTPNQYGRPWFPYAKTIFVSRSFRNCANFLNIWRNFFWSSILLHVSYHVAIYTTHSFHLELPMNWTWAVRVFRRKDNFMNNVSVNKKALY